MGGKIRSAAKASFNFRLGLGSTGKKRAYGPQEFDRSSRSTKAAEAMQIMEMLGLALLRLEPYGIQPSRKAQEWQRNMLVRACG